MRRESDMDPGARSIDCQIDRAKDGIQVENLRVVKYVGERGMVG